MRCQICVALGSLCSVDFDNKSLKHWQLHADIHRLQINDEFDSSTRIFRFCFPNLASSENRGDVEKKVLAKRECVKDEVDEFTGGGPVKLKRLETYCRNAVTEMKTSKDGLIACGVCPSKLKVVRKNGRRMWDNGLNHVFSHLAGQIFNCRWCDFRTPKSIVLKSHALSAHRKRPGMFQCISDRNMDFDELKKIIDRCYKAASTRAVNGNVKIIIEKDLKVKVEKMDERKVVKKMKMETVGVKTETARMASGGIKKTSSNTLKDHWSQLQKESGAKESMRCRLCSKDIKTPRGTAANAMEHLARIHLKKILFNCRLCAQGFTNYADAARHIKGIHGTSATGNYIDNSQKYEAEIMASLTMCYGKPEIKKKGKK